MPTFMELMSLGGTLFGIFIGNIITSNNDMTMDMTTVLRKAAKAGMGKSGQFDGCGYPKRLYDNLSVIVEGSIPSLPAIK